MVNRVLIGATILLFVFVTVFYFVRQDAPAVDVSSLTESEPLYEVYVDQVPFSVSLAADQTARAQGLSGMLALPQGQGKLFVFEESAPYRFWMKDMNFAIDMLWFDAEGKLVYIEHTATPASYPTLFEPPRPALYVLEINAGLADTYDFSTSSQLVLSAELETCLQEGCFIQ
tara:strand:+ start:517 stop:1032 length:516 start_codon:yes stop_codon:yes gene_type:complete